MSSTAVRAEAVNTIAWLSASPGLSVPVYQRRYRWDAEKCQQLLVDVRRVARDGHGSHFFGSILYTSTTGPGLEEWMLVDGQQRVTTVVLLLAALRDTPDGLPVEACAAVSRIVQASPGRPRLRLRHGQAADLQAILSRDAAAPSGAEASPVRANYEYFLGEVRHDGEAIWRGLQRLEHVAITLTARSSPQQVFESLNSTAAPLQDHELIHNHVLMGLTGAQQEDIEDRYWRPIEQRTGEAINSFFRDYLIMRRGRDSDLAGEHGIYRAFRSEFPEPRYETLLVDADEWAAYARVYSLLRDPTQVEVDQIRRQLNHVNTFGAAIYPLLLAVYRDYEAGGIGKGMLVGILEQVQTLYLRKMVVGLSRDHLATQLCRKRRQYGYPIRDLVRRTPSDERVRHALGYRPLPHAGHVLARIESLDAPVELEVEHIFPQFAPETWSGDGQRRWWEMSEAERAQYRELLNTIGNLTLLEQPLNAAAGNQPFSAKKSIYEKSEVRGTRELVKLPAWTSAAIAARTRRMTDTFLQIWPVDLVVSPDDPEDLVPILDAARKPGYYAGHATELEYARYRGALWENRNFKDLYRHVFTELWTTRRDDVLAYAARFPDLIVCEPEPHRRYTPLPGGTHYLFTGFFPQYFLEQIQTILDELDLADELFVKYAAEDD